MIISQLKSLKLLIMLLCMVCIHHIHAQDWNQVGASILGESVNDNFGQVVSMSADGNTIAIATTRKTINEQNDGQVRVFRNNGGTWESLGQVLDGSGFIDYFGRSLSLSADGNTLAIGANGEGTVTRSGVNYKGRVEVYKFSEGAWVKMGDDIVGKGIGDNTGVAVDLSNDGATLVIGSFYQDYTDTQPGYISIYEFSNDNWVQLGADIEGEAADDLFGISVSISADGTIVASGAIHNDGTGDNAGHVRVFEYGNDSWVQIGSDIDGEAEGDSFGTVVSLSANGTILGIGASNNDGNGERAGHVRAYQYDNGDWAQLGADIDGAAVSDRFGQSLSISADGSVLAAGAYYNGGNGYRSGHVKVFEWANDAWTQIGDDISGEANSDSFGSSVSLSGSGYDFVAGAPYNDEAGDGAGNARVFTSCPVGQTCKSVSVIICADNTFTTPGGHVISAASTYSETIDFVLTNYIVTVDEDIFCCPEGVNCTEAATTICTDQVFTTPNGTEYTEDGRFVETVDATTQMNWTITLDPDIDCCPDGFTCNIIDVTECANAIYTSPLGNTLSDNSTVVDMDTENQIRNTYNVTFDRAEVTTDIYQNALIATSGSVTYQANTNATGVLSFDKSQNQWVNLNSLADDLNGKSRSVFMWVKSEANVVSTHQTLFAINTASGGNVTLLWIDNDSDNLEVNDGSNNQSASFNMNGEVWNYVGYTYDASSNETVVYVNGIENDRFTNSQSADATAQYSLGQEFDNSNTGNFYNGSMAEISVWDEVLTGVNIHLAMEARITSSHPKHANLVGYYSVFGECNDDVAVLKDHSGKGNNGAMQNGFTQDFKNVQAVDGFNAVGWYDNLSWTKDGAEVSTTSEFTTAVAVADYEFTATRNFIKSTDIWTMTVHSNAAIVDNIADETLCADDPITRSVPPNTVTYLDFEETEDNYVEVNSVVDALVGKNRSVFMWINKESNIGSGDFNEILVMQNSDVENQSRFYMRSTEKLALWDGDNDRLNSSTVLDNGTWYFVGYTYDHTTGETKLYVNGTEEDSGILDMPLGEGWFASLGMKYEDNGPVDFLDGQLAEISIWDKVLAESEVAALMREAPAPDAANLVADYGTLASIADNQLRDQSNNANHGAASHNTIIVNNMEEALPGYDASVHYTISWKKEGEEFDTDATGNITVEEGTFNYSVEYGSPFFPKTEEFRLSYTELIPTQPVDVTAGVSGDVILEVDDVPGATYQWFEKKDVLIRKVNGDEDFPGLNRPSLSYNSVISEGENHIYVGTSQGLLVSEDQGDTWSFKRKGLASGFSLNEIRGLAVEGDVVFVTGELGVAVSLDKGNTWRTTLNENSGLVTGDVGDVVQGMDECYIDQGVLYATSRIGRVLKSADNGVSWERESALGSLFGNTNIYISGDLQIGTTANATNGPGVFIPGKAVIIPGSGQEKVTVTTEDFGLTNTDVCTDAIHIGDRYLVGTNKGLFSSTDLDNWSLVSDMGSSYINQLLIESNKVYAYSASKVYVSENNGITWSVLKSVSGSGFDITGDKIYAVNYQTLFITADRETLKDDTNTSGTNSIQGAITHQLAINNLSVDRDQTEYYVEVSKDGCTETSEVVTLTVSNSIASVTMVDVSGAEDNGAITVTAKLDNTVAGGFTVDVSTADGTATIADNDYTAVSTQTLTFVGTAGEEQTFTVLPTTDTDFEDDETLTISLSNLANTALSIIISDNATVTITNDDSDDVTAPVKPVITSITDDTGESNSDGITSDSNIIISGTAEPLSSVEVFTQYGTVRSTTTDANGDWSLDITDITLVELSFNLTAEATDLAGNTSAASDTFVLTSDRTAPAKPVITGITDDSGSSNSDGLTNDENIIISGTAEALSSVEVFSQFGSVRTTTTDANGDWSLDITDITLVELSFDLTAKATDLGGNSSATSDIFVLTADYTAPAKPVITSITDDTGSSNSDGVTNDANIIISGTAEALSSVEVFTQYGTVRTTEADANGEWALDITDISLVELSFNLTAKATDLAGNTSAASDIFVLKPDYTAPAKPVITSISDDTGSSNSDGVTNDANIIISGTAEALSIIEVFTQYGSVRTTTTDANGDWSLDITDISLVELSFNLTAKATDLAGNISATSDAFVLKPDFTAPAKPVITSITDDTGSSNSDGITNDANIMISGTAEALSSVEVFTQYGSVRATTTDANGDWSLDITDISLVELSFNLTAKATDLAGNSSAASDVFVLKPDYTLPAVTIDIDNNSVAGYLITALFNEDVSGLELSEISVTGGTASNLVQLTQSSYSFLVTSTGSTADVIINANVAEDLAGNGNTASSQLTLGFTPVAASEDFTNLQSLSKTEEINIYPNPASSVLNIDLSELSAKEVDILMINTAGIAVFKKSHFTGKTLRLDVSGYTSGLYIIQFYDGTTVIRKKVMVKK